MKTMKYLLVALATGSLMAACNTDIESLTIQRPLTYDDQYYQNLRDYKASDHEIAFGWFAQYGAQNSAAVRFMGLPDSLDICSMWGGIPAKENTEIWDEIRFVHNLHPAKGYQCAHNHLMRKLTNTILRRLTMKQRQCRRVMNEPLHLIVPLKCMLNISLTRCS